jgi:hypothetical protein
MCNGPHPIWLDEHGERVPTRPCHVPNCTREWPVYRKRIQHLIMGGWKPTQPMLDVNWCGHSQQVIPWPDADGYWSLVPIVEAVAR